MGARANAHLDRDVADLVLRAPVRALLVNRDALADDRLLERLERELHGGVTLLGRLHLLLGRPLRGRGSVLLEHGRLHRQRRVLALELVLPLVPSFSGLPFQPAIDRTNPSLTGKGSFTIFFLPARSASPR